MIKKLVLKWPQKKTGKYTLYDMFEDGQIELAPEYQRQFTELCDERNAIDSVLEAAMNHAKAMQQANRKRLHELWNRVYDDLGLHRTVKLNYSDGMLIPEKPDDEGTPE